MELNGKLWGLLLILSLAQVGHSQLQCYICDNCPEVNTNTPKMHCDEDYFNSNGNTEPSTQTTTEITIGTTEMPTEMPSPTTTTQGSTTSTTTTTTSTTEEPSSSTTTEIQTTSSSNSTTEGPITSYSSSSTNFSTTTTTTSTTTTEQTPGTTETSTPVETTTASGVTETTTTTSNTTGNSTTVTLTTVPQPPTPSTVHPTSSIPTPPNPERETPIDDTTKYNVNGTETDHGIVKPYIASSQFRVRQVRAVSDYTYHCFKVNANNGNDTMTVQRGCSRVRATESVCGHWKEENPSMGNVKCYPCSNSLCNGSNTLNISLGALALTIVAVFLQWK